ncbi:MAG: hypothetical protein A3F18_00455 [Legionellales bacterium RIFCSPHIGHO2_12_FULL_37_14]|nr:MAG: hypothetical protein A3F18_00455 [Legionellales bacterium RIFCSPHIGHO2_12_FULL_37_14]
MLIKYFYILLSFITTAILTIGLHELGHALAARFFAIKIQSISLGFGKALFTYQDKKKRIWIIARWPIGGYVKLLNTRIEKVSKAKWPYAFDKRPCGQRIIVLLAGSCANIIFAWLFFIIYFLLGHYYHPPIIDEVRPKSPAEAAGFSASAQILAINKQAITSWEDANIALFKSVNKHFIDIKIKSPTGAIREEKLILNLHNMPKKPSSIWDCLGIKPNIKIKHLYPKQTLISSIKLSFAALLNISNLLFTLVLQIILGNLPISLLIGPFTFFTLNAYAFMQGVSVYSYFIGLFSLSLGIINLLPIPGLDGASIMYTCIEKIRIKPIPIAYEVLFYRLTTIAFWVFVVKLLTNDINFFI